MATTVNRAGDAILRDTIMYDKRAVIGTSVFLDSIIPSGDNAPRQSLIGRLIFSLC